MVIKCQNVHYINLISLAKWHGIDLYNCKTLDIRANIVLSTFKVQKRSLEALTPNMTAHHMSTQGGSNQWETDADRFSFYFCKQT